MAKRDLLNNEDFRAYQEDLRTDLNICIDTLNALVTSQDFTPHNEQRMNFVRGQIFTLEAIINKPTTYLEVKSVSARKEDVELANKIHSRNLSAFRRMWHKAVRKGSHGS